MDFRAALLDQTRAFGELIRDADPSTPVPTCGEWTLRQLVRHVGRGNRWAAQIVSDRLQQPLDPRDVRDGKPPEDQQAALDWFDSGAQMLIDAVERIGPEMRVWTFLGPRPAGWWVRRRVHEVAVHRADAAMALGADYDLPAELAADALSEWVERVSVESRRKAPPLEVGRSLHLHATDDGLGPSGEWMITHHPEDGLIWSHEHGKGDAALRGTATALLLAMTRRRTAADAGVEVLGDAAVWERWLERTPF